MYSILVFRYHKIFKKRSGYTKAADLGDEGAFMMLATMYGLDEYTEYNIDKIVSVLEWIIDSN